MNPFIDVRVVPSYGTLKAVLTWSVTPEVAGGNFIIRRSRDGVHQWEELGSGVGISSFVDERIVSQGKLDEFYYQVILQHGGLRHDSPVVSTFGKASRSEFGHARGIMHQEWNKLRLQTEIRILKLKVGAPPCPTCTDPDTGQHKGLSLCQTCWGTGLEGGYHPPVPSYMALITESPQMTVIEGGGAGTADPLQSKVRLVAFPLLRYQDLIVIPDTDRRYLVETVDVHKLNGKIPVVLMADLLYLRRTDIRYQIPL